MCIRDRQQVWLQFEGVNASAAVLLNGQQLCTHDGGYSTFRAEVTELPVSYTHLYAASCFRVKARQISGDIVQVLYSKGQIFDFIRHTACLLYTSRCV